MPACDVVVPMYYDVRFNDITSLLRHICDVIFFFNTEINVFRISKHKSLE